MEHVKFFHFNHTNSPFRDTMQSYTAVASLPSAEHIRTILDLMLKNDPVTITMDFGYTKVHPKDNYNKKVGRAMAQSKIKEITLAVKKVSITASHVYIHFETRVDGEFEILLRLNTRTNHATVVCYDMVLGY